MQHNPCLLDRQEHQGLQRWTRNLQPWADLGKGLQGTGLISIHPSIPVLGTPSPPSPIAVASARKGHGAGTSSRRLPITDEPCLAWQAHYHHGFIAQHLLAQLALSSLSSPISLSASILNPRALPRRNCRCSVTLLTASAALVRIRLCIRK